MLAGIPDFHAELIRSVDDADTTWSEWSWSGNRADGQDLKVRGVTLFEVSNGKIIAGTLYLEDVGRAALSIEDAVENFPERRPDHAA